MSAYTQRCQTTVFISTSLAEKTAARYCIKVYSGRGKEVGTSSIMEGFECEKDKYLYKLKLDGEWCIDYLGTDKIDLQNKRNMKMLSNVPELSQTHWQVNARRIWDGELSIIHNGTPDSYLIQRRSMMSNPLTIKLDVQQSPAYFTAFDFFIMKIIQARICL